MDLPFTDVFGAVLCRERTHGACQQEVAIFPNEFSRNLTEPLFRARPFIPRAAEVNAEAAAGYRFAPTKSHEGDDDLVV